LGFATGVKKEGEKILDVPGFERWVSEQERKKEKKKEKSEGPKGERKGKKGKEQITTQRF